MEQWLMSLAVWLRGYNSGIALAAIATLLVIFGSDINRFVRRLVIRQHFLIRVAVFIALCAFGYGLLTVWLTPVLASLLASVSGLWYLAVVAGGFVLLGLLAEGFHKR